MGGAAINLRGCSPLALDAHQLGAVVPDVRTLFGVGSLIADPLIPSPGAPMACVPAGISFIVAPTCPDGSFMPPCSSGRSCGAANTAAQTGLEAQIRNFLMRFDPTAAPPGGQPGTLTDRLSSDPVLLVGVAAAALLAVYLIGGRR